MTKTEPPPRKSGVGDTLKRIRLTKAEKKRSRPPKPSFLPEDNPAEEKRSGQTPEEGEFLVGGCARPLAPLPHLVAIRSNQNAAQTPITGLDPDHSSFNRDLTLLSAMSIPRRGLVMSFQGVTGPNSQITADHFSDLRRASVPNSRVMDFCRFREFPADFSIALPWTQPLVVQSMESNFMARRCWYDIATTAASRSVPHNLSTRLFGGIPVPSPFQLHQNLGTNNRFPYFQRSSSDERHRHDLVRAHSIQSSSQASSFRESVDPSRQLMNHRKSHCASKTQTTSSSVGLILACPEDRGMLNDHLSFLRTQIEFFRASIEDVMLHTRGRNKEVTLRQVGVRCRHCTDVAVEKRRKGTTYFPSTLMCIYQAAQNIHIEHFQSGLCPQMPQDVKARFVEYGATKSFSSGAGKAYWADSARKQGLIDTEDGIRFITDVHHSTFCTT